VADSLAGIRGAFIVGVLAYLTYMVIDLTQSYYELASLRLAVVLICLVPLIAHRIWRAFRPRRITAILALALILLLEIETQMRAPDVPFSNPAAWFLNMIVMIFNAIFFLGRPFVFASFYFLLTVHYIARGYIAAPQVSIKIFTVWFYHGMAYLLGVCLHVWWFRICYERVLREERIVTEQERRIHLERELARVQERDALFCDLHDHLGASIVDLVQLLSRIQPSGETPWAADLAQAQAAARQNWQ